MTERDTLLSTADVGLDQAILAPRSVALVGASANPKSTASRPLAYLQRSGFGGEIYPVSVRVDSIQGTHVWSSLSTLPAVPDHVFVMTPSDQVLDVVAECVQLGVRVVTVLASGFTEAGEPGARRTGQLMKLIAGSRTRLIGPSSLGVVNLRNRMTLTANAAFAEPDLPIGTTLAVSQSGSMMGALVSRGKSLGVGFAALVSVGNEIDVDAGDICASTLDDPTITNYMLFLESIKGAQSLRRFAEGAHARGKAVVVYKLGRSAAGAELALSHTGALAGSDEVAAAFFDAYAMARVKTLDGLLESTTLADRLPIRQRSGPSPRVGAVTTTGGGAAMVVDQLGVLGIDVVAPSEQTFRRFAEIGAPVRPGRVVDLTLAGTRYDIMHAALRILIDAGEHDLLLVIVGSSARFEPEVAVRPIAELAGAKVPLAAFLVPDAPEGMAMLKEAGVACFRSPESCADVVAAVLSRSQPVQLVAAAAPVGETVTHPLDERQAYQVLGGLGITHAPIAVAGLEQASVADLPFGFPVAAKVLSSQVMHKSDIGGVILNIPDTEALARAVTTIRRNVSLHHPELGAVPVLVQPMVTDGIAEVLVGYRVDDEVGPIVLLALGGELTGIYQDRNIRLAPVDRGTARDMVRSVRALRVLDGYRGRAGGDVTALCDAIVAMSQLAYSSNVREAEANPLIVRAAGGGVVAVDALARCVGPAEEVS